MNTPNAAATPPTPHTARIEIDLAGCDTKADLLQRIADAMQFPDWFGHNWDALSDCLCDLSWLPAPAYAIELRHLQDLRETAPDVLRTVLDIFEEATAFWADEGVSFQVERPDDGGAAGSAT